MPLTIHQFNRALRKEGIRVGCDIHVYFETLRDGRWEPTWVPSAHPDWWWESISERKLDSGAAELVLPMPEGATQMEKYSVVSDYFKAMPLDQAEAQYGGDRDFKWSFNLPGEHGDYEVRFRRRDYGWFGFIAHGVRGGDEDSFKQRGAPTDLSAPVQREIDGWEGDGHSHSWLMVDELLASKGIKRHPFHAEWLRKNIPEPDKTRMVFFFDN